MINRAISEISWQRRKKTKQQQQNLMGGARIAVGSHNITSDFV